MNFLLHRHLAERDLGSGLAGVGAMFPDLWRMADRRVRPSNVGIARPTTASDALASILAGIDHHVAADRWFHGADAFVAGERLIAEQYRTHRIGASKIGLFAHVAWELCLDGALVRRTGLDETLQSLRNGFGAAAGSPADDAVSLHHFSRAERSAGDRAHFDVRMQRLFADLARGPWVTNYLTGTGIARCVEGMRSRLEFGPLTHDDRERLGEVFDAVSDTADEAIVEILL